MSHFLCRISTKSMKQSEQQAVNKFSTRKGDVFWLCHPKLTLVYLYSLQLCVPAVPNVESLSQLLVLNSITLTVYASNVVHPEGMAVYH